MKFLPYVSRETVPPATFRLWSHTGLVQYLPSWILLTISSTVLAVTEHRYVKVPQLSICVAAFLAGTVLLPDRQDGKTTRGAAYLPAYIVMLAPPIIIALLDRRYEFVLVFLALLVVLFVGIRVLTAKWTEKPAVEITNDVLTVRLSGYMPAKLERISLMDLRQVVITGPRVNRDWVFEFKDGSRREFRPHFPRGADEAMVAILREVNTGRFEVTVEAPLFLEL